MRLITVLAVVLVTTAATGPATGPSFREEQLRYPRVRAAYASQRAVWQQRLRQHHLDPARLEVFLRVFKVGQRLEAWGRNQGEGRFQLLRTFPLAATSGRLGPKRREGDGQVPEGFYHIDRYNPHSLYHLSLGLNYPNASDVQLGDPRPGGDIFIHGSNVTIGCLPLTDAGIQDLYVLAVEARYAGQARIPVHIFPFPLTAASLHARAGSRHHAFWQSLVAGYRYFEEHHQLPAIEVNDRGAYELACQP